MTSDDSLLTRGSLLMRIRDPRDSAAWSQFADLYSPLIQRYLRKHGLQDADAADVAQDTLRKVFQAIGKLDYDRGKGRFRGWLLTITRNNLIAHVNKQKQAVQGSGNSAIQGFLDLQPDDADAREWDQMCHRQLIEYAMEQIRQNFEPATWRAFHCTAIESRSAEDVATELGMTAAAVYTSKSRVTARLRVVIEELEGEE